MPNAVDHLKPVEPEWARAKQIFVQFGIGRSTLHRLTKEGRIESTVIKTGGGPKGIRLFNVASIRKLLANSLS
jgi:hypothetical protein